MANNHQLALITGSSRGIGKAVAINFAKNGIDVVITGRNESRLKKVKEELNQFDIKSYIFLQIYLKKILLKILLIFL